MAGWAAAGQAASSLIGDWISSSSQAATNAMNLQIMRENNAWQEKMSDTAVQRRVADLKAAGINPILAAGQAAGQPAVSTATMQNPGAAFGNLGGQVGSALQLASNIDLQNAQARAAKAQAAKARSETPDEYTDPDSGEVTFYPGDNHILGNQAVRNAQAAAGVDVNQAQQILKNIELMGTNIDINKWEQQLRMQSAQIQKATMQYTIRLSQMSVQQIQQELDISQPDAEFMKSQLGSAARKAQLAIGVGSGAVNTAHSALSLAGRLVP